MSLMLALLLLQAPTYTPKPTCWRTVERTAYSSACIPAAKLAAYMGRYTLWRMNSQLKPFPVYEYAVPKGHTPPPFYVHTTRTGFTYIDHRKP